MGVRLGSLIYVSNQIAPPEYRMRAAVNNSIPLAGRAERAELASPLAIEPRKVSREATVYAVFAIE